MSIGGGIIDGLCAILPTPFDAATGKLDRVTAAENAERLNGDWHVEAFLLGGAYGEFTSLSDQERLDLVASVRARLPQVKIMSCAAKLATSATVELGRQMLAAGADHAMVTVPLAVEVSEEETWSHFSTLADEIGDDLVVYNNPVFGQDMHLHLVEQVLGSPAYVGMKQGTRSMRSMAETVSVAAGAAGAPFVLGASDLVAPLALAAGTNGISSTNCWVFPAAVRGTLAAFARGDVDHARRLHASWAPYRAFAARAGQPATVKAAMAQRGYAMDASVRPPLHPLDSADADHLAGVLKRCDDELRKATGD